MISFKLLKVCALMAKDGCASYFLLTVQDVLIDLLKRLNNTSTPMYWYCCAMIDIHIREPEIEYTTSGLHTFVPARRRQVSEMRPLTHVYDLPGNGEGHLRALLSLAPLLFLRLDAPTHRDWLHHNASEPEAGRRCQTPLRRVHPLPHGLRYFLRRFDLTPGLLHVRCSHN